MFLKGKEIITAELYINIRLSKENLLKYVQISCLN